LNNLFLVPRPRRPRLQQSRADSAPISRDYHHGSAPPRGQSPPPRRAEPRREAFREEMQWRQTESHLRPSQDPRGWEEEEEEEEERQQQQQQQQQQQRGGPPAAERFQEHRRPVHQDSNVSSRQRYEGTTSINERNRYPSPVPPPIG